MDYWRDQTDTEVVHTVRYTDEQGDEWMTEERKPRTQKPAPAPVQVPCCNCNKAGTQRYIAGSHHATTCPMYIAPKPVQPAKAQTLPDTAAAAAKAAVSTLAAKQIGYGSIDSDDAEMAEKRVRRLERAVELLSGKIHNLNWYIPAKHAKVSASAARVLRQNSFGLDGSNRIITQQQLESDIVQDAIASIRSLTPIELAGGVEGFPSRRRAKVWHVEYTKEQIAGIKEELREELYESIHDCHRSLIGSIDSAAQKLEKAREAAEATPKDIDKAVSDHTAALRSTVREACKRFELCLKAAEMFDDTGSLDSLFDATRDAIRTQTLAANAILRARKVKVVTLPKTVA